jgi:SAM-dependent methyltransferase
VGGDAIDWLERCPSESLDLLVDVCSVTHFLKQPSHHIPGVNEGFVRVMEESARCLKPGGSLVCATDVQWAAGLGADYPLGQAEFSLESDLLEAVGSAGLSIDSLCELRSVAELPSAAWSYVPHWMGDMPLVLGVTGFVARRPPRP